MTQLFTRENKTGEIPYYGYYSISGETNVTSYINGQRDKTYGINDLFQYITSINKNIVHTLNNKYNGIQLNNTTPGFRFKYNGLQDENDPTKRFRLTNLDSSYNRVPLFGIYKTTYYKLTDDNIREVVKQWINQETYYDILSNYGPINEWDTSHITNMSNLFEEMDTFNDDISNWNVSNVTNMSYMFSNASLFNQYIGNWNISNVTNMDYMFNGASSFNQSFYNWIDNYNVDIDVSLNMTLSNNGVQYIFNGSSSLEYKYAIGQFTNNTLKTVIDLYYSDNTEYHKRHSTNDISNFDVSGITIMDNLFSDLPKFNDDITDWNVSNVTSMSSMFKNATSFNQYIGKWDVSNVTNMDNMFNGATSYYTSLYNWGLSCELSFEIINNVIKIVINTRSTSSNNIFSNTDITLNDINGNVTDNNIYDAIDLYFKYNDTYNTKYRNIQLLDTSQVTNMSELFKDSSFNIDISGWNVSNVTNMTSMFSGASSFSQNINKWVINNCIMTNMFNGATSLTESNLYNIETTWNIFIQYDIINNTFYVNAPKDATNMFSNTNLNYSKLILWSSNVESSNIASSNVSCKSCQNNTKVYDKTQQNSNISKKMLQSKMIQNRKRLVYHNSNKQNIHNIIFRHDFDENLQLFQKYKTSYRNRVNSYLRSDQILIYSKLKIRDFMNRIKI